MHSSGSCLRPVTQTGRAASLLQGLVQPLNGTAKPTPPPSKRQPQAGGLTLLTRLNPTGTEWPASAPRQAPLVLSSGRKFWLSNSSLPGDIPCNSKSLPGLLGQQPLSALPATWSPPGTPFGKCGQGRGGSTNHRWVKAPGVEAHLSWSGFCGSVTCGDEVSLLRGVGWKRALFFLSKAPGWRQSPVCHYLAGQSQSNLNPSLLPALLIKITEKLKKKKMWHFLLLRSREQHPPSHTETEERRASSWQGGSSRARNSREHWASLRLHARSVPQWQQDIFRALKDKKTHISSSGTESCMTFEGSILNLFPSSPLQ